MATTQENTRIRILLIEDDDEDAFLVRHALSESSHLSFSVDRAHTLAEATEHLGAERYDAAVLDLTLPDSEGIATVEAIARASTALPFVVVTDHHDPAIGLQSVRSGAQGFISKTEATGKALAREIEHAIERQQMRQELEDHRANLEILVEARTRELRDAIERLKQHNKAKTDFVLNVSHELRTPLTSMMYIVENMLDGVSGPVTEQVRESLGMLNHDCKRLKRTVEDILDISKIDVNRFAMLHVPIPVIRFVSHVIFCLAASAQKHGISLSYLVDAEPMFVSGDPDKLERSLLNLVQNAIKYSKRGDVIEVRLGLDPTNESRLACRVIDNGPGIPAEHINNVTERYYRVGDHIEGTGLGLPIVKQLVEHHGGELTLESPPSGHARGTQASILLPLCEAPHILVIAHQETARTFIHLHLSAEGYRVECCEDTDRALERMEEQPPDLLILDLSMPDMGGVQLTSQIKSSPELRQIHLVAITEGESDTLADEVLKGFSIPLLRTPWRPDELLRLVEHQLMGAYSLSEPPG